MTAPPCVLCSMKWLQAVASEPLWPMPSSTANATIGTSAEQIGAQSIIPAKRGKPNWKLHGVRAQMRAAFPTERYRQSVHAETVFSAIKRKLSAKALRANLLADVPMVAFAVELGIGHNGSDATACNHFIEQRAQGGAVIDRSLVGPLRQDQTQTGIDSQEPFEPVTPRHGSAAMLFPPPNEKRADGSGRQARRIHRYSALALPRRRPAALKTAHHFSQNLGNNLLFHSQHEAKEGAVVGHRLELQRSPQLTMFSQPHFRRAKSPVLITHQTQNRQQLRLRETLRRKTMTVRRHNFAAHFQRHTGKRHKSNFTHASPIYT